MTVSNAFADWILPLLNNVRGGSNGQVLASCVWHSDSHPSLSINLFTSQFKCHSSGCGKMGNYEQFCEIFGEKPNPQIREFLYNSSPKPQMLVQEKYISERIVNNYVKNLTPSIRERLKVDRGLSNEVIDRFYLGFDNKSKRVTIPIKDRLGNIQNIRMWSWNEKAKYISYMVGFGSASVYPISILEETGNIVIAEGEFDCLKLISEGIPAVTGTCGAGTWREKWNSYFLGKIVTIAYDNDIAGRKGSERLSKSLVASGINVRSIIWNGILSEGEDVSDFFLKHRKTANDFKPLIESAIWHNPSSNPNRADSKSNLHSRISPSRNTSSKSQADGLVDLILANETNLFKDELGNPFARLRVGDHWEIRQIRGKAFRRWATKVYWEEKNKTLNSDSLNSSLKVIEGLACFDGSKHQLRNRVAFYDDAIWYDLADEKWRAVRITGEGWNIVEDVPILFKRYAHQKPQIEPSQDAKINEIGEYVNLVNQNQMILLLVYLVTCLIPDIPHPILILYGPQGSAKTTLFRILNRLVDPSRIEILAFPRNVNELIQSLSHHWTAYFDNVTKLQDWISDSICRATTGDGFSKRQLYTDDEDVIYSFKRCIGLNGINLAANRPDLLDRAIIFEHSRIPKDERRPEKEFWEKFEKSRARILGGMFDALSSAMRIGPAFNLQELPRMADFAVWGYAISKALGIGGDRFLTIYDENLATQNQEVLQDSLVGQSIVAFMSTRDSWKGSPSSLLGELEEEAGTLNINTRMRNWPKSANVLSRRLNEIKINLEETGILIEMARLGDKVGSRQIYLQKG